MGGIRSSVRRDNAEGSVHEQVPPNYMNRTLPTACRNFHYPLWEQLAGDHQLVQSY